MKKYLTLLTFLSFVLLSCDNKEPLEDTYVNILLQVSETTVWEPIWGGSDAQTVEHMLVKEPSETEWQKLVMGCIEGFEYKHGHAYELEVCKTILANPPADGSKYSYKLIKVISDTPPATQPNELPEDAKFKLKMVQLTPFMDLDTPLPAPFDLLTFRILNHKDEYVFPDNPEFLQYYDSIVVSSPAMPNTYRVYQKEAEESGSIEKYTAQWSSHFFEKGDFQICIKGYKGKEAIYEYSINQTMRERDFLGVDWKNGSVTLANPKTNCIYCLLDSSYEFLLTDTQEQNKTPYIKIQVANSSNLTESEYLKKQETGLKWLLKKYLGEQPAQNTNTSEFKTLPENADIVEVYKNDTTQAALIHYDSDDLYTEYYYIIAEPR